MKALTFALLLPLPLFVFAQEEPFIVDPAVISFEAFHPERQIFFRLTLKGKTRAYERYFLGGKDITAWTAKDSIEQFNLWLLRAEFAGQKVRVRVDNLGRGKSNRRINKISDLLTIARPELAIKETRRALSRVARRLEEIRKAEEAPRFMNEVKTRRLAVELWESLKTPEKKR